LLSRNDNRPNKASVANVAADMPYAGLAVVPTSSR
jgi:hypothetical protein